MNAIKCLIGAFLFIFCNELSFSQVVKHGNLERHYLDELKTLSTLSKTEFEKAIEIGKKNQKLSSDKDISFFKKHIERIQCFDGPLNTSAYKKDLYVINQELLGKNDINTNFFTRHETGEIRQISFYSSIDYTPFSVIQDLNTQGFKLVLTTTDAKDYRLYPNSFYYKNGQFFVSVSYLPYNINSIQLPTIISCTTVTYYKNRTMK